ncbi:protein PROTON GRADIENT REGULATION 5, chloroplastic-like [Primulina eburnea]|uniref:protein PROTON GRADIENT REGULATION 5, chloroplastic-like n=1 Tax=Primulina eburnea TaxID=1245227 RepID=UPI003C6C7C48
MLYQINSTKILQHKISSPRGIKQLLAYCCCSSSSMASCSICSASAFLGSWGISIAGEDHAILQSKASAAHVRVAPPPFRLRPMMRNVNEGKGLFAPIVVVARNVIGKKRFNQLRGKAIALHSQVITEFCKSIGADGKQRQGLIRIAKKNGEKLGFLA